MNRRIALMLMLAVFTGLAALPSTVRAQDDEKKQVLQRIKDRIPEINSYKKAEKVGESWSGKLEAVKREYLEDSNEKRLPVLLKEENADRARFFEIVAKEQGTSPDVVGVKWAEAAFKHAKGGEWMKTIDKDKKEQWVQKPKEK